MKKLIFTAAAALLALVACNREPVDNGAHDVRFTSNIENTFTVKSQAPLAEGGTVRIIAGAPISKSTDAVAAGGKLTPETAIKWKENQSEKTTFVGIYPSHGETSPVLENYSLLGEGSVQDFEYQNNFLAALAKDVTPGSVVNLEFKHPFVKMVMNIDNQLTGTPEVTGVTVSDVALVANLILDAGTVVPAPYKGSVIATKNSGKFEVIIMPQDAKPIISVSVAEKTYTFKINSSTTFAAGKSYTASLTLKDNTPADGDPVSFGFSVTDWDDDATPLVATDVTGEWSVVGDVTGGWENDLLMVEGSTPGVVEASITYNTGDEFKLRYERNWDNGLSAGLKDNVECVGDSAWDGFLTTSNNNIKLLEAGQYKLTFNTVSWAFTATKMD